MGLRSRDAISLRGKRSNGRERGKRDAQDAIGVRSDSFPLPFKRLPRRLRVVTGAFGSQVYSPTFLVKLVDSLCNSESFITYK